MTSGFCPTFPTFSTTFPSVAFCLRLVISTLLFWKLLWLMLVIRIISRKPGKWFDHIQNQKTNRIYFLPPHSWLHDSLHVSWKLPMVFDEQDISSISSAIISHGASQTSSVLYPFRFPNATILEHVLSWEGKLHVWGSLSSHPISNSTFHKWFKFTIWIWQNEHKSYDSRTTLTYALPVRSKE